MSLSHKDELARLALTIRILSAEGVEKANSGHPGMPMGSADYASVLWAEHLNFNPRDPKWINRDRFVLSAGHGSMLLYSLLHLFGFDLPMSELQQFRQFESKTPGHPEFNWTVGVETTTGPLGQGISNAVGIALSQKLLAARFGSDLFDYKVYGIAGDGCMMEGVASEACSTAGHLGLNNLIFFYDDNEISIGGDTDVCFTESVPKRFEAYGWNILEINGHNQAEAMAALEQAKKEEKRPTLIVAHTTIGFGSPNKAGSHDVHGSPLGKDEMAKTKERLGWTEAESFTVPKDVKAFTEQRVAQKLEDYNAWQEKYAAWRKNNQDKAAELDRMLSRDVPVALRDELVKELNDGKKDATRNISGRAIQVIAKHVPSFIGGSVDLEPSTKTTIKGSADIMPGAFAGKNLRYGVREHAAGAIANGLAYSECWIPFTATFLVFSDYMRPTLRLAAISHIQTLFIFTHDSFWVGEDGPTHEPIEHVASLRLIPNLYVYRPADGVEVAAAYYDALTLKNRPSTLLFTRQNLPPLPRHALNVDDVMKGGYVVTNPDATDLVIVATGSEVAAACDAAAALTQKGKKCRVVSMPCVERFLEQSQEYRDRVLPPNAKKISIEAGTTIGWQRIVGSNGLLIGIDHYGASAPGEVLCEKFGFTAAKIEQQILAWLG